MKKQLQKSSRHQIPNYQLLATDVLVNQSLLIYLLKNGRIRMFHLLKAKKTSLETDKTIAKIILSTRLHHT